MTRDRTLSIILNTYNLEHSIGSILASIPLPETADMECVLVDRASEDQTLAMAIGGLRKMKVKTVAIQNGFGSAASAYNTGIFHAKGDYIKFISPYIYADRFTKFYHRAVAVSGHFDMILPVPTGLLPEPEIMTGLGALEKMIGWDAIPEFGTVLFSRALIHDHNLMLADQPQMAGLGLELVIKALANAGRALLIPAHCNPTGIRKELLIPQTTEFSDFFHIDAICRAMEDIRTIPGMRPSIISALMNAYIPQKMMVCIENLLRAGRGHTAIGNYIRLHGYDRFLQARVIADRKLKRKVFIWKHTPWLYRARSAT